MKIKPFLRICAVVLLTLLTGCMNPQNLNAAAYGANCPKMVLPGSPDSLFAPPLCLLSIRTSDSTPRAWGSGSLSGAPVPSRVFIQKEGDTKNYPIDSYVSDSGLIGSAMYKHAPTRSQSAGSGRTAEQLLLLNLTPGTYRISTIAFCGYTGGTELTENTASFTVEAGSSRYIGCLNLTVAQRDKNILFGDTLRLTGQIDPIKFKAADFEWAGKEYGSARISAFLK